MPTLGSNYLLANIGCHVLGIYSLTTAQLVSEVALPLSAPLLKRPVRLLRAVWFTATGRHGIALAAVLGRREMPVEWWATGMLAVAVAEPAGCIEVFAVRTSAVVIDSCTSPARICARHRCSCYKHHACLLTCTSGRL